MAQPKPFAKTQQPRPARVSRPDPTAKVADRQRAQVHQAILNEADQTVDEAYRVGMNLLHERVMEPEEIVATLQPFLAEADRLRGTAERFAPIQRETASA